MRSSWEIAPCFQKYLGSLACRALTRQAGTLTGGTGQWKGAGSASEKVDRRNSGTHSRSPMAGCSLSVSHCMLAAALESRDFLPSCKAFPSRASGFLARNRRSPRFGRDSCNSLPSWRLRTVFPICSILKNIFQSYSLWNGLILFFFQLLYCFTFTPARYQNPYSGIRLDIDQIRIHVQVLLQTAFILMP